MSISKCCAKNLKFQMPQKTCLSSKLRQNFALRYVNLREQLPHFYPCRWMGFKFYFCTTTIVLVSSIKKEFKKKKKYTFRFLICVTETHSLLKHSFSAIQWKDKQQSLAVTVRSELTTNDPKSFVLPLYYVPIYTAQNVKTINTLNNYKQT